MCGLAGMILRPKERIEDELNYFSKVFTYLLLLSEERGPHATGVVWLKHNGKKRILKRPQKARHFVRDKSFPSFLASVDSDVTWLAGHTRWPTVGDARNNANNHPLHTGSIVGCHNGHIANADLLFRRLALPKTAAVDSEIIFRMAEDTLCKGHINIAAFKRKLALCCGKISAVMASVTCPEEIAIIKGNMPLEIIDSKAHDVVTYSSDARYMDVALVNQRSWKPVDLGLMAIAALTFDHLNASSCVTFNLASAVETH